MTDLLRATSSSVMSGFCDCGEANPCDCEYASYGRYDITPETPGHPRSGRCATCREVTVGEPVRRGKFIYCSKASCDPVVTIRLKPCCGLVSVGDICDCLHMVKSTRVAAEMSFGTDWYGRAGAR